MRSISIACVRECFSERINWSAASGGYLLTTAVVSALFCLTVSLFVLSSDVLAASVILPRTGQSLCYNAAGVVVPCSGTAQDGEKIMGAAWPGPRFSVSGDCVTDNMTGLVWSGAADSAGTLTWTAALDWVATLNAGGGLCSFTDWRLPSIVELETLVNAGYNERTCGTAACASNSDWLNAEGFSGVQQGNYWSGTTFAGDTTQAWGVTMLNGSVGFGYKTVLHNIWPVRGSGDLPASPWKSGQLTTYYARDDGALEPGVVWPAPRFTVNGTAGTVTDNLTGLVWLKNSNCFGTQSWENALASAKNLASPSCGLNDGSGAGDWRLPNRKELLSLAAFQYFNPALSDAAGSAKWSAGNPFNNVMTNYEYWSSTSLADTSSAWYLGMNVGNVYFRSKSLAANVWPVRSGLSGVFVSLTMSKTGNGSGTVFSSPPGISCGLQCSGFFTAGSVLSLTALPDSGSVFEGFGNGSACFDDKVALSTNTSCAAIFSLCPDDPISVGGTRYSSFSEAYSNAGLSDTVRLIAVNHDEGLKFTAEKDLTIQGGWDCDFGTRVSYTIVGYVEISAGSVTFDSIVIL